MSIRRVIIIVLDSVGIGAMPDAAEYGDAGAHTLKHTAEAMGGLELPALASMGLGCVDDIPGLSALPDPRACYGKMAEQSRAKDTTTGHWEMAGVISEHPPQLYPQGFPKKLIAAFETAIGSPILGNIAASGTDIIERLGAEHLRSGFPIVYTSADSVFQIACHEDRVPVEELYRCCEIARGLCDAYQVGRVIARPFAGKPGNFFRTPRRRDLAMLPPAPTVLEQLANKDIPVIGIGKIGDIFSERGLSKSFHTQSNHEGIAQLFRSLETETEGVLFVNLVDFDMLYGHRRDPAGYAMALVEFDAALGEILGKLDSKDLLIISADHGCDPTFAGTDHTREFVPLLALAPGNAAGGSLGIRDSFADIGATLAELYKVPLLAGKSFLGQCSR